jgi:ABC-type histidine transport system ATPase subunit
MTNEPPFIGVRYAQKNYGSVDVLKDINLQAKKGKS